MFPIRDHNPPGTTPYVVYGLIALNVAVFIANLGAFSDPRALAQLYYTRAIIPAHITSGVHYSSLVTSMFLHGGFMHIAGNMLFLWIFGDNLEDKMGHLPFLAFYLLCGIGAGLIHVMTAPFSMVPTIGASGAIAGVLGGYLLLFPRARVDVLLIFIIFFKVFSVPAWLMLGLWLGLQFIGGVGADPTTGGVAYWAHVGGFAVGLILTLPLWLSLGGPRFWNRNAGQPPHPGQRYELNPTRIPRVPRK